MTNTYNIVEFENSFNMTRNNVFIRKFSNKLDAMQGLMNLEANDKEHLSYFPNHQFPSA